MLKVKFISLYKKNYCIQLRRHKERTGSRVTKKNERMDARGAAFLLTLPKPKFPPKPIYPSPKQKPKPPNPGNFPAIPKLTLPNFYNLNSPFSFFVFTLFFSFLTLSHQTHFSFKSQWHRHGAKAMADPQS